MRPIWRGGASEAPLHSTWDGEMPHRGSNGATPKSWRLEGGGYIAASCLWDGVSWFTEGTRALCPGSSEHITERRSRRSSTVIRTPSLGTYGRVLRQVRRFQHCSVRILRVRTPMHELHARHTLTPYVNIIGTKALPQSQLLWYIQLITAPLCFYSVCNPIAQCQTIPLVILGSPLPNLVPSQRDHQSSSTSPFHGDRTRCYSTRKCHQHRR